MYEVEVKVPADHDRVRERLVTLGAEARGTVEQVDTYFDHPARSFAATDEALRLRREVDRTDDRDDDGTDDREGGRASDRGGARTADREVPRVVLTYKGPKVDDTSKSRREVETAVGDLDAADALLRAVGFAPAAEVRKSRERYDLDGFAVVLDDVDGLGAFVEVEAAADAATVEDLRDGALSLLERLGLDPADQVRAAYLELLEDAPT